MLFSHKGLIVKYVHRYWKKVKKVPFLPNTNKYFNYIQEETLYTAIAWSWEEICWLFY